MDSYLLVVVLVAPLVAVNEWAVMVEAFSSFFESAQIFSDNRQH